VDVEEMEVQEVLGHLVDGLKMRSLEGVEVDSEDQEGGEVMGAEEGEV